MTERRNLLQESLAAIERLQARLAASERAGREPIAIIGAGCRYPGGVTEPDALWQLVSGGVDAIGPVPAERQALCGVPEDVAAEWRGGFLGNIDRFDPQFFSISAREATTLDPQQRLLLETAYEAMESAGLAVDRLAGSATGVFVGITTADYGKLVGAGGPDAADVYAATGNALNAAAGRLAFTFGFHGPCVALDTACSSSLVAVHLACQSLRNRESDLALAGGVNVVLSPDATALFERWGMMAADARCKTFDAAADGFVRSEGCAVIALKRLSDAVAAGDPVLAVIRGSAVNSDGRSSGLTVPNGPAQEALIRQALSNSALLPADIDYVEAHGTGTSLGDPIEVEALGAALAAGRPAERKLLIGSIKTNLGHTEAASGLAGLLKVVLALRHEVVPPHLHFAAPSPRIDWAALPVAVPTAPTPWPRTERPRRAGVSSFGFSGTNAHVVLEEAPVAPAAVPDAALPVLVPLSARGDDALRELAGRYAEHLAASPGASLAGIAATAATGRAALPQRAALVAESAAELQQQLRALAAGTLPPGASRGALRAGERPKIAFLFTGQGSQYAGMGRALYEGEPVFRAVIDRADAVLAPLLGRGLTALLFEDGAALGRTAFTQPALFALEVALAELWRSWGIVPSVVLGHSVGEYAAACVAGVFTLEDGLRLIAERGRLMQALPAGGAMAAVFAAEARVAAAIAPQARRLAVAGLNGPEETVIAGEAAALDAVLAELAAEGIAARRLDVSHAFHSPLLDPVLDGLESAASTVPHAPPRLPLVSNVTGAVFGPGEAPDARYWRRHAREPVRFAAGLEALRRAGVTALVEIGPHPTLLGLAARALPDAGWATAASLRRATRDRHQMLSALGQLFVRGAAVNWSAVLPEGATRAALPTYPFQRERIWAAPRRAAAAPAAGHPLLGERHALAAMPGTSIWEREIGLDTHPWLDDHRVQGAAIVPATAYLEMALAAGAELLGPGSLSFRDSENLKPMILRDGERRRVQASLVEGPGGARFAVHSRAADAPAAQPWTAHVTGTLARAAAPDAPGTAALDAVRHGAERELARDEFYAAMHARGNEWGRCFQGLEHVWRRGREAVARVRVMPELAGEVARYNFHPAVSDACGHALVALTSLGGAALGGTGREGAFVGGGVAETRFHRQPAGDTLFAHATLRPDAAAEPNVVTGDVRVFDAAGALVSETLGARLWYLDEGAAPRDATEDLYAIAWEEQARGEAGSRAAPADATWLVFADRGGIAAEIAARRRAAGRRTVLAVPGEGWSFRDDLATVAPGEAADYRRLLEAVGDHAAILHLWSLDAAEAPGGDPVAAALAAGPESLLHLLHALRAAPFPLRPRLWTVTAGAQAVLPDEAVPAPLGAALWGLGRSLSVEHAEYWGGLAEVERDGDAARSAAALLEEVEHATAEDKLAFRRGGRSVPRLRHRPASAGPGRLPAAGFAPRADRTYLVTGGLGGIGLAVARWLAERGARHLLLVGRNALPPREDWAGLDPASPAGRRAAAVAAIEALGATVDTAALDIAAPGALEQCLAARRRRGAPEVCGAVHAAGVLRFQPLATQDVAAVRAELAAKVAGAWQLHQTLAGLPLDCFVLCSSSSALLSSPLLGVYAAGNAALDALAQARRAQGLPALSVNWGTWGEVGMAVEGGRTATGDMLSGMGLLTNRRALAALDALLAAGDAQAAVMPMDWAAFARAYPGFSADPFLRELVGGAAGGAAAGATPGGLTAAALRAAPELQRPALAERYLRAEAARVLGLAPERLDPAQPLALYGLDSLMAVQLKNRIEADLGAVVAMIRFLQGPSIAQLVPAVLDALPAGPAAVVAHAPDTAELWEEGSL